MNLETQQDCWTQGSKSANSHTWPLDDYDDDDDDDELEKNVRGNGRSESGVCMGDCVCPNRDVVADHFSITVY
jgi:hypothetical protein